jgi:hypothetical protein
MKCSKEIIEHELPKVGDRISSVLCCLDCHCLNIDQSPRNEQYCNNCHSDNIGYRYWVLDGSTNKFKEWHYSKTPFVVLHNFDGTHGTESRNLKDLDALLEAIKETCVKKDLRFGQLIEIVKGNNWDDLFNVNNTDFLNEVKEI